MADYFPFHRLGLVRNPFGSLSREEWVEIAVMPSEVQKLLARGFDHLQVLGKKGYGKTTTLLALQAHFAESGERIAYERIPEGERHFHTPSGDLDRFCLDEAQRMDFATRRRMFQAVRQGLRLITGSHADLTPYFARRGLALETLSLDGKIPPDHLQAILARRIAYFARNENHPRFDEGAVEWLHQTFKGDLRAMEFFLYRFFQSLDGPGIIPRPSLAQFESHPATAQKTEGH